ncbi:Lrp/AsnC family transcriptional regulator [Paragemmobacter ruber]|uniref:AsnC family transcriptional regulator n=1 Tax=Paragemmobacter ruber TaxID=1985673 RepID=A0ABW9Y278_9RHOB|nr:Lrp/AsnC family transcriptional regulator [Rhodobacter ruber]NBE06613.1 AsnC family transcriptional regulator [Rhodobacter ruber]
MDDLDRRLISELRINSRASLPRLAELLGVARGTVKARLDKLVSSGTIRSFTIRVGDDSPDMLRAIMVIELMGKNIRATVSTIKRIPGIVTVSNTNGVWDLVAEIETANLTEMNGIISEVRSLNGVSKSETFILLGAA